MTESLRSLLAGLHAERERTWAGAELVLNINERRQAVETANHDGFVKPGDPVAPFTLEIAGGGTLSLDQLLRQGPAVLLFFRFASCPSCNIALPYYQRNLYQPLQHLGASLIAISPQIPERLVEIQRAHQLAFPVACDRNNALARAFGILFEANPPWRRAMQEKGEALGDITGTGTWELPMPAIIVVAPDRTVRFADVSPDWHVRTEAGPVLEAVRSIAFQPAA